MNLSEAREALTGPIASVSTPFNRDGSVDSDSLRDMVEHDIAAGSGTILLTHGDSLYSILTDDEIAEVTKVVAEQTAGRAMVVAADRAWGTGKEMEFAKYACAAGADMLMVMPPDWAASCTPDTLVEHYAAVAEHIPTMIVTNVFIPRGEAFGLETLQKAREQVPGVLAVKDDFCGSFGRKLGLLARDRWATISGGQKQNHLDMHPYGCDGYLSTYIRFKPSVAHDYWRAIQSGDLDAARDTIAKCDMPLFDFIGKLTGGFDAGIHGALELFGIAKRWRRKPYHTLNDVEMEHLAGFFNGLGLL